MGNGGIIAIFPSMGWPKGLKRGVLATEKETTMASVTPFKGGAKKLSATTGRLLVMIEALLKAKLHRAVGSLSVNQLARETEEQLVNLIIPDSEFELEQEKELLEFLSARIDERNEKCLNNRERITDEWNESRLTAQQDTELEGLDEMNIEQLEQFKVYISIATKKIEWLLSFSPKLHVQFDIDEGMFSGLLEREERRTRKSFGEIKRTRRGNSPARSSSSSSQSAQDGGYHFDLPRARGRGDPRIGVEAGAGAGANDDEES